MCDTNLYYYKSIKDKKCNGVIDIKKSPIARADDETKKNFSIKIETAKRNYFIFCNNEEDCDSWLLALQEAAGDSIVVRKKDAAELEDNVLSQLMIRDNVFGTINEALQVARDGEKIIVYPGEYKVFFSKKL